MGKGKKNLYQTNVSQGFYFVIIDSLIHTFFGFFLVSMISLVFTFYFLYSHVCFNQLIVKSPLNWANKNLKKPLDLQILDF